MEVGVIYRSANEYLLLYSLPNGLLIAIGEVLALEECDPMGPALTHSGLQPHHHTEMDLKQHLLPLPQVLIQPQVLTF